MIVIASRQGARHKRDGERRLFARRRAGAFAADEPERLVDGLLGALALRSAEVVIPSEITMSPKGARLNNSPTVRPPHPSACRQSASVTETKP